MTGTIFYFSGTGNTFWAVKTLCSMNKSFSSYSIEEELDVDSLIEASDVVGFAYPIYGSDIPEPMKNFMKKCQTTQLKKTIILVTQWAFSGDGSTTSREFLSPNFIIKQSLHLNMPNNISVTKFRWVFPYTTDPIIIAKKLAKAQKKLEKYNKRIQLGEIKIAGDYPIARWVAKIQKKPFRKYYKQFLDDITFNPTRCTNCNFCVEHCPVDNLVKGELTPTTKGECAMCLRCYNYCPTSAVQYMGADHMLQRGNPYRMLDKDFMQELLKYKK